MSVPQRNTTQLPEELVEFVASGVDVYVATRDAALEPESVLAMGVKVHDEGSSLTVYLPEALAAPTLANLNDNRQIAITITRPRDHRSVQIKGRMQRVRPSTSADRELQAVSRAALVEGFAAVGIPRSATRRLVWWPSVAVEVEVSDVFTQTPGPGAGEPLAAARV